MRDCLSSKLLFSYQQYLSTEYLNNNKACTSGTWGDSLQWTCVAICPANTYYSNTSTTVPLCVTKCPSNYYAYPIDRVCYEGGSCPTSPVRYFADDTTSLCVNSCPSGYYSDNSTGRCLIYCSSSTFAH